MPASALTRRRFYGGMKRVMKRCRSVSCEPPSPGEPRVYSHNNLQFAHQLRVLTNYKDINGGGEHDRETAPGGGGEGGKSRIYNRPDITRRDLALPAAIISRVTEQHFDDDRTAIDPPLFSAKCVSELISCSIRLDLARMVVLCNRRHIYVLKL